MDRQGLLKVVTQPDERLLFAKVLDQAAFSLKRHSPAFTDFLDMAKSGKFLEVLSYERDLQVMAFGGTEDTERRMLGFAPDYMEFGKEDFPICALRIRKNKKFGQTDLSHRDYLGSILGLGIDRGKIGDIFVGEEETICFVTQEIAAYITANLHKVSRTPVEVEETAVGKISVEKEMEVRHLSVASLRLDAVAGAALHLARGKMQDYISAEKANVNWSVATNPSCVLKEGDMVSVRGFGRFRVLSIGGRTKKDRIVVEVGIYI